MLEGTRHRAKAAAHRSLLVRAYKALLTIELFFVQHMGHRLRLPLQDDLVRTKMLGGKGAEEAEEVRMSRRMVGNQVLDSSGTGLEHNWGLSLRGGVDPMVLVGSG